MIIKQAFSCDTDDCIYFDAQEEDCGKGSITIQEGRCCDCEKRQDVPESQSPVSADPSYGKFRSQPIKAGASK